MNNFSVSYMTSVQIEVIRHIFVVFRVDDYYLIICRVLLAPCRVTHFGKFQDRTSRCRRSPSGARRYTSMDPWFGSGLTHSPAI